MLLSCGSDGNRCQSRHLHSSFKNLRAVSRKQSHVQDTAGNPNRFGHGGFICHFNTIAVCENHARLQADECCRRTRFNGLNSKSLPRQQNSLETKVPADFRSHRSDVNDRTAGHGAPVARDQFVVRAVGDRPAEPDPPVTGGRSIVAPVVLVQQIQSTIPDVIDHVVPLLICQQILIQVARQKTILSADCRTGFVLDEIADISIQPCVQLWAQTGIPETRP